MVSFSDRIWRSFLHVHEFSYCYHITAIIQISQVSLKRTQCWCERGVKHLKCKGETQIGSHIQISKPIVSDHVETRPWCGPQHWFVATLWCEKYSVNQLLASRKVLNSFETFKI